MDPGRRIDAGIGFEGRHLLAQRGLQGLGLRYLTAQLLGALLHVLALGLHGLARGLRSGRAGFAYADGMLGRFSGRVQCLAGHVPTGRLECGGVGMDGRHLVVVTQQQLALGRRDVDVLRPLAETAREVMVAVGALAVCNETLEPSKLMADPWWQAASIAVAASRPTRPGRRVVFLMWTFRCGQSAILQLRAPAPQPYGEGNHDEAGQCAPEHVGGEHHRIPFGHDLMVRVVEPGDVVS